MPIALVTNAGASAPSISADAVTGAIDTTGATLLVAGCITNDAQTTPTDSKGNTWVAIAGTAQTFAIFSQVFYVKNPTVGSGHTFTCAGANRLAAIVVTAFSGTDTAANVDQSSSANNNGNATIQAGSITPSADNEVVVATYAGNALDETGIDESYTKTNEQNLNPGSSYAISMAYKVQTTATATNPTWSMSAISVNHASLSSYKEPGGATATVKQLAALGVG